MEMTFVVLYTHQKTKKAKTWQDGTLRLIEGTKAILFDEKSVKLESFFVKANQVSVGADLESDRFLITVEDCKPLNNQETKTVPATECLEAKKTQLLPAKIPLIVPKGVKRKRAGFVPPRKIQPVIKEEIAQESEPCITAVEKHSRHSSCESLFSFTGSTSGNLMNLYASKKEEPKIRDKEHSEDVLQNRLLPQNNGMPQNVLHNLVVPQNNGLLQTTSTQQSKAVAQKGQLPHFKENVADDTFEVSKPSDFIKEEDLESSECDDNLQTNVNLQKSGGEKRSTSQILALIGSKVKFKPLVKSTANMKCGLPNDILPSKDNIDNLSQNSTHDGMEPSGRPGIKNTAVNSTLSGIKDLNENCFTATAGVNKSVTDNVFSMGDESFSTFEISFSPLSTFSEDSNEASCNRDSPTIPCPHYDVPNGKQEGPVCGKPDSCHEVGEKKIPVMKDVVPQSSSSLRCSQDPSQSDSLFSDVDLSVFNTPTAMFSPPCPDVRTPKTEFDDEEPIQLPSSNVPGLVESPDAKSDVSSIVQMNLKGLRTENEICDSDMSQDILQNISVESVERSHMAGDFNRASSSSSSQGTYSQDTMEFIDSQTTLQLVPRKFSNLNECVADNTFAPYGKQSIHELDSVESNVADKIQEHHRKDDPDSLHMDEYSFVNRNVVQQDSEDISSCNANQNSSNNIIQPNLGESDPVAIDGESCFTSEDNAKLSAMRTAAQTPCEDQTFSVDDKTGRHVNNFGNMFFVDDDSSGEDIGSLLHTGFTQEIKTSNKVFNTRTASRGCMASTLPHPDELMRSASSHMISMTSNDIPGDRGNTIKRVKRTLSNYSLKGSVCSQVATRDIQGDGSLPGGRIISHGGEKPYAHDNRGEAVSDSHHGLSVWRKPQIHRNTKKGTTEELRFPTKAEVMNQSLPCRQQRIPAEFNSFQDYKQVLTSVLIEHLNIILFDLSKTLHTALDKADTSKFSTHGGDSLKSSNPICQHGLPSKIVRVKKDGPNKDRYFYACGEPRQQQCKFFQWADQCKSLSSSSAFQRTSSIELTDANSIASYLKGQGLSMYCQCILLRKAFDSKWKWKKSSSWKNRESDSVKKSIYLKISRKEASTAYSKDDLWIISHDLSFDCGKTFIARSVYYGPNSDNEVEIEPITGYSPSNWPSQTSCHAVHVGNMSSELTCLSNIQSLAPQTLPLLPHLLSRNPNSKQSGGKFTNPALVNMRSGFLDTSFNIMLQTAEAYISKFNLNPDQSEALRRVANMLVKDGSQEHSQSVALIHGVFGAGKSYLLSVIVLFLNDMFEADDRDARNCHVERKILISSTTNVAVDRILLGLMELGFDGFVRVGSVRKIAKPILPFSVHAFGSESQELKELQSMMKGDLTQSEKMYIKKTIEKQKIGENRQKLGRVKVVGVTCAACSFPCMKDMKFSMVLLDECSQMTEPASLLPIGKAECDKLVLVGDPKQLDPTIQGSECGSGHGLEQTLFDRLVLMGHTSILLRTQYRCHPMISAIANKLFYDDQLLDGISEQDRPPLIDLPIVCFFDVTDGREQYDTRTGSFSNDKESECVVSLVQRLIACDVEPSSIGVITLYKAQTGNIYSRLASTKMCNNKEMKSIQISTVDAFQGGEKDVIILSCVRTNNVGFMDSDKRANVALTRARNHLFIVGNLFNLRKNGLWGRVINYCRGVTDGIQNVQLLRKAVTQV